MYYTPVVSSHCAISTTPSLSLLEVCPDNTLLTDVENTDLFCTIDRPCVTLSTTVAQVYQCLPGQNQWKRKCVGVACFVKDKFKYNFKISNFHSFEVDEFMAGLNFADQDEADHFRKAIEEKLRMKQSRKDRRNTVKQPTGAPSPLLTSLTEALPPPTFGAPPPPHPMGGVAGLSSPRRRLRCPGTCTESAGLDLLLNLTNNYNVSFYNPEARKHA